MEFKVFIWGIVFLILISLIFLIFILINVDPYNASILSFVLFYASFFAAGAGTFILIGLYLRRIFFKKKALFRLLRSSFKQGLLISIILTSFLLLWKLIN